MACCGGERQRAGRLDVELRAAAAAGNRFAALVEGAPAGLGLSLVKSLIELHGDAVALASALGQGTTVICRLPLAAKPPAVLAAG